MKIKDLIEIGKNKGYYDYSKMIISDIYNIGIKDIINYEDKEITNEIYTNFINKLNLLDKGKPIQYVIGNVNFFGLKLKVNENVLIPRFETEELVDNTIKYIEKYFDINKNLKILDLCSGSGAIGLTIKSKFNNFDLDLIDISDKALEVSKENAKDLNLDINFIQNDLLTNINKKYDVIISNPPYIRIDEEIEDIVYNNEPHLALYAGVDGLDCYRKILEQCKNNLNDNYLIAFEIGYDQKDKIKELANKYLNNIDTWCLKDLAGRDRMFFIKNKE